MLEDEPLEGVVPDRQHVEEAECTQRGQGVEDVSFGRPAQACVIGTRSADNGARGDRPCPPLSLPWSMSSTFNAASSNSRRRHGVRA